MWRRNYQPLPQDKSEEHINDAERWDPSAFFHAHHMAHSPVLIVTPSCPKQSSQNSLTLRIRHHRVMHGYRQRPPHLFGPPLHQVCLVPHRPCSAGNPKHVHQF
jgi:hypothetical protein